MLSQLHILHYNPCEHCAQNVDVLRGRSLAVGALAHHAALLRTTAGRVRSHSPIRRVGQFLFCCYSKLWRSLVWNLVLQSDIQSITSGSSNWNALADLPYNSASAVCLMRVQVRGFMIFEGFIAFYLLCFLAIIHDNNCLFVGDYAIRRAVSLRCHHDDECDGSAQRLRWWIFNQFSTYYVYILVRQSTGFIA